MPLLRFQPEDLGGCQYFFIVVGITSSDEEDDDIVGGQTVYAYFCLLRSGRDRVELLHNECVATESQHLAVKRLGYAVKEASIG